MGSVLGRRAAGLLTLAAALLVLGGCGGKPGSVAGKVTYKGKPLTGGSIVFVVDEKQQPAGSIDENGMYKIAKVRSGTAKVAVQTIESTVEVPKEMKMMMDPTKMGGPKDGPKAGGGTPPKLVVVPKKYHSPDTSGLTREIKSGDNQIDIDLTD